VADDRVEPPIPDEALVVRGGLMENFEEMVEDAQTESLRVGYAGLSVRAGMNVTSEQLVRAGKIPNSNVRLSRAGRLREGGFPLRKLEGEYHYNIVVGDRADITTMRRLADLFDEAQPNPVPRSERRRQ
jgi:hypothetical protein